MEQNNQIKLSYYQRNKEEIKARKKQFKKENPELARQIEKSRYERRKDKMKIYAANNPERMKEILRRSYGKNKKSGCNIAEINIYQNRGFILLSLLALAQISKKSHFL